MNTQVRLLVHALLFVLGIVLMVWGMVATKYGAAGIGLIVAAVNVQQFLKKNRAMTAGQIRDAP